MFKRAAGVLLVACVLHLAFGVATVLADGDLGRVNHILIVMQENHSFDNYLGALSYAPKSPYHSARKCRENDHQCVDGLTCLQTAHNGLACINANLDDDGKLVFAFHDPRLCVVPDLDHDWAGTHHEANFKEPNETLKESLNNGFVLQNDLTEQIDGQGAESQSPPDDDTMGFYTQDDLRFYYYLANNFAISDRYFASVLGPTFPNRSYLMAATSFGHLVSDETVAFGPGQLPVPYQPITGTIFDLLDSNKVSWTDYYSDTPESVSFLDLNRLAVKSRDISSFFVDAAAGQLPQVAFVESASGGNPFNPQPETDEHPPTDIRRGQAFVSKVLNALRNGPNWSDSIVFVVYDEHGGFYDHVAPARVRPEGSSTPDGIGPGQCADLSNPPASSKLGGGINCSESQAAAAALCPKATPNQPFPSNCASFDTTGFRVPFFAVSPFSKPHYVSHTVGDHTSLLALIEKRFFHNGHRSMDNGRTFLTRRDQHADTLEDLFDFNHSPSLHTQVPVASPPANDCTPPPG